MPPKWQDVPLGNLRLKGSLRLHGVISRLGTTFISSRAEQSTKWRSTGSIYVQVAYAIHCCKYAMGRSLTSIAKIGSTSLPTNFLYKLGGVSFHIMIWKIRMDRMGFEPMASCLQSRRSSADLPALTSLDIRKDRGNSINLNILFDRRDFSV